MADKTAPTPVDPVEFVAAVEHPVRRSDAETLLTMMTTLTGWPARMWGPSIVGFGRYHYHYESGRQGDFLVTGFSPRKTSLVVYVMPGYDDIGEQLSRLGKHRLGKSCLYINKLTDIDLGVLEEIVAGGVRKMCENFETWAE